MVALLDSTERRQAVSMANRRRAILRKVNTGKVRHQGREATDMVRRLAKVAILAKDLPAASTEARLLHSTAEDHRGTSTTRRGDCLNTPTLWALSVR